MFTFILLIFIPLDWWYSLVVMYVCLTESIKLFPFTQLYLDFLDGITLSTNNLWVQVPKHIQRLAFSLFVFKLKVFSSKKKLRMPQCKLIYIFWYEIRYCFDGIDNGANENITRNKFMGKKLKKRWSFWWESGISWGVQWSSNNWHF